MRYQAQIKFDLEDHLGELSKEQIKEATRDYIETLDNESEVTVSNVQVDISEYPRSAGSIEDVRRIDPEVSMAPAIEAHLVERDQPSGLLPEMGVTHPWDQGAWIFPDDHELAEVERAAKDHYEAKRGLAPAYAEGVKQGFLEEATRRNLIEGEATEEGNE